MRRKRHTPEQVVRKLREAKADLAGGQSVEEVCKKLEVSPQTYFRWKKEYGGAKADEVKRLKEMERENQRTSRMQRASACSSAGCRLGREARRPTSHAPSHRARLVRS
jgi:uncharacterized protein YjcR